ncbi:MAG: hypothetical protein AB7O80_08675, partial [Acetobacteraceae bacterium]
ENSLHKVDKADVYLLLVSAFRYGQVLKDPKRNPKGLSVTELEFERAVERKLPIIVFMMDEKARYPANLVAAETATSKRKLAAFRKRVRNPDEWITAYFRTVADLRSGAITSLAELRRRLEARTTACATAPSRSAPPADAIPVPPDFYPHPPYIPGYPFQGRVRELDLLTSWATSPHDPVLVFEAIGGMGKSMVTWEWTTRHADTARTDWAGQLWYSFSEHGADMHDFCVTALAYITRQPKDALKPKPTWELATELLQHLRKRPFLLVLDGLERVLVAYNRSDAAQVSDEDVEAATDPLQRPQRDCIRPDDADLLRQFCAAGPSKILVTSRLMPTDLLNPSSRPFPGVRHECLTGLTRDDAAAMLMATGIQGDPRSIGCYLEEQFESHPLFIGIVGYVVLNYPTASGDFDRWVNAPDGGAALDLTNPEIRRRRTHILGMAFKRLNSDEREVITLIAIIANSVPLQVVETLNVARIELRASNAHNSGLNNVLVSLQDSGLLRWSQIERTYNLHPVVRRFAIDSMDDCTRSNMGQLVADFFKNCPMTNYNDARSLEDLTNPIQVVRALNLAGKIPEAWTALRHDLRNALSRLELHETCFELMGPLFPHGWDAPPVGIEDVDLAADAAASLLHSMRHHDLALKQARFAIEARMQCGISKRLGQYIRHFSIIAFASGDRLRAERVLDLAKLVAIAAADNELALQCDLLKTLNLVNLNRLNEARSLWNCLNDKLMSGESTTEQLNATIAHHKAWLSFREGNLTEQELRVAIHASCKPGITALARRLHALAGRWHQSHGRDDDAVTAYDRAITTAREANRHDPDSEVRRGISLAKLGRTEEARAAAASAERDPPRAALASFYLQIQEHEKARTHALCGYRWASGVCDRFTLHWDLEECRAVLRALNEPEPQLPPYDPAKHRPEPWEADIRRMLDEHAARQRFEDTAPDSTP